MASGLTNHARVLRLRCFLMTTSLHHPDETASNADRDMAARFEPKSLRTYTSSQAVLAKSAGIYHWTPEGRRLYDFSSGVLVANLGHNPRSWMKRFNQYMGWPQSLAELTNGETADRSVPAGYFAALPMTAYNAISGIESETSRRLAALLQERPGGKR